MTLLSRLLRVAARRGVRRNDTGDRVSSDEKTGELPGLQIRSGGPSHRLERVSHLEKLGKLIPFLVGATWLPLATFTLVEWILTGRPEPLLRDLSVHTRLLIALPLLLFSERVLDFRSGETIGRLFDEGYVPPSEVERTRALIARVARWRASVVPEMVILAIALFSGIATLTGLVAPAGGVHGLDEARIGVVRIWYALVSLPLFQFVLGRSLFGWLLWVRLLFGFAGTQLRLLPAHADRRGGIAFLKEPTVVYCMVILLAESSVLASGWATKIINYGAKADQFKPLFFTFVIIGLFLGLAPLVVFVPKLIRARVAAQRRFGNLTSDYTARFDRRWLGTGERAEVLGTPDLQSFADLANCFANVEKMGVLIFGVPDGIRLLVAAVIPIIPLLFLMSSAQEVIMRLLKMVIGGPG
jgi:hypothetical protein